MPHPASQSTLPSPLRYDPSIERPEKGEARTHAKLLETMRGIQETTFKDYGHSLRPVHAKSHALLEGEFRVLGGLPPALAQGLFANPATYPVVLRLSTNPGDVLDDSVSGPRGLALKVIGVAGERLPGSGREATQDFVMANAPAFAAPDTAAFARTLGLLAATTDTGQAWKKAFSAALRGTERAVEAFGGKSPAVANLGGQPLTHPLGETFYTQTPLRYGNHVAKLSVAPASPEMTALAGSPIEVRGRPNALRGLAIDFFRRHGAEWEVRVQLRTDPDTMPIEDASVEWPQDESPYLPVARITVPPQPAWSEARARQVDDGLSFNPWQGLAAHQPLGSINRARKTAYARTAAFRSERGGCPLHHPRTRFPLSDAPAQVYGTAPGRGGRRPRTPHARADARGQPTKDGARHAVAGIAFGLAAGLVLSGLMLSRRARRY